MRQDSSRLISPVTPLPLHFPQNNHKTLNPDWQARARCGVQPRGAGGLALERESFDVWPASLAVLSVFIDCGRLFFFLGQLELELGWLGPGRWRASERYTTQQLRG